MLRKNDITDFRSRAKANFFHDTANAQSLQMRTGLSSFCRINYI